MINRIGDNNYTNPYVRNTQKTVGSGEKAPAFLLNYDEDGVVWDRESSDEKKGALDSKVSDGIHVHISERCSKQQRRMQRLSIYLPLWLRLQRYCCK